MTPDPDLERRVRRLEDQLARVERDWADERAAQARQVRRSAYLRVGLLVLVLGAYLAYFYGLMSLI